MNNNYTVKTIPAIEPLFKLQIEIDPSLFDSILNTNELEEILIDRSLEYFESINVYQPLDELLLDRENEYYLDIQHDLDRVAMEQKQQIQEKCDGYAQDLIETLPNYISERLVNTEQLADGSIIAIQEQAEQNCREWFAAIIQDIHSRSQNAANKYQHEINDYLNQAIDRCNTKIERNRAKIKELKVQIQLPSFANNVNTRSPAENSRENEPYITSSAEVKSATEDDGNNAINSNSSNHSKISKPFDKAA